MVRIDEPFLSEITELLIHDRFDDGGEEYGSDVERDVDSDDSDTLNSSIPSFEFLFWTYTKYFVYTYYRY